MRESGRGEPPQEAIEGAGRFDTINQLWTEGFAEARLINMPSGRLVLGTDVGGRTGENEDALLLDTDHDAFAVMDGMGGYEKGEIASRIVGEEIQRQLRENLEPLQMHINAQRRMKEATISDGGAPYVAGQVVKKELRIWYAGDVQLMIIDAKGKITFKTAPTWLGDSPRGRSVGKPTRTAANFENHDKIICASDGLWDNIEPEFAAEIVHRKKLPEAIAILRDTAMSNMKHPFGANEEFGGNPDNVTILIYQKLPVPLRGQD
jgi:serine/threonine protein phosphatase PrpC